MSEPSIGHSAGVIKFKLCVMMFLQFFIWGAWLPLIFGYLGDAPAGLGFSSWQRICINNAFPVAAILAMFFANEFVDRRFAAEKYLAFSHLIGGLSILGLFWARDFWTFFILMSVHCLFYVPTISVTNAIAFANLKDPQKEFGPVRLWGTIGWIAAAWPFIFLLVDWAKVPSMEEAGGMVAWLGAAFKTPLAGADLLEGKSYAFAVSGAASLALAVVSLSLPHTPPRVRAGEGESATFEAIGYLAKPFILILFLVTFIDATVHDGYFVFAFTYLEKVGVPSNWVQAAMSVGQIAEILTMAILGPVLAKLGWKTTMVIGVLGHAARFTVFALVPNPYCAVAINVLHGICYAFFFATLYIFIDAYFPKDARTSAQGLFNLLVLGIGPIFSRIIWENLQVYYTVNDVVQYNKLLLYPAGAATVAAFLLLVAFNPPRIEPPAEVVAGD